MRSADQWVEQWIGNVAHVRQLLIETDDVRNQVAFQNDVNLLLAAVADLESPRPKLPYGIEATFGLLPAQPLADPPDVDARRSRGALEQLTRMRQVGKAAAKSLH
ncbi:MAG TPA: hypothetical protein VH374_23430 [Polyangia bacterium]|jgi:hypothetical protein|nr:hypothetical protein [Polyangia bacterium]